MACVRNNFVFVSNNPMKARPLIRYKDAWDSIIIIHDDVTQWKQFPRYWPFVWGIYWLPVNCPHKGQWRRALMFSFICAWIYAWVNNHEAGDLRRNCAHYDVIVMISWVKYNIRIVVYQQAIWFTAIFYLKRSFFFIAFVGYDIWGFVIIPSNVTKAYFQGPILQTGINFNPSISKQTHPS